MNRLTHLLKAASGALVALLMLLAVAVAMYWMVDNGIVAFTLKVAFWFLVTWVIVGAINHYSRQRRNP